MFENGPGGSFHRFDSDPDSGSYGWAYLSRREEIHDRIDDFVADGLSTADEDCQAVQRCVHEDGIAAETLATFPEVPSSRSRESTSILPAEQTEVYPEVQRLLPRG